VWDAYDGKWPDEWVFIAADGVELWRTSEPTETGLSTNTIWLQFGAIPEIGRYVGAVRYVRLVYDGNPSSATRCSKGRQPPLRIFENR
jgi:hypothetical protein